MGNGGLQQSLIQNTDPDTQPIDGLKQELLNTQRTLGWMDLVIANIDDSVCVVDRDGKIIFTNDSFAKLSNQHRIYLLGQPFTNAINLENTKGPLSDQIKDSPEALKNATEINGLYQINKEGRSKYIKLSVSYLPTLEQTVLLLQDVTGQEELNIMRRKFISLASHQLRTPLSVINVHIQMLKDGYQGDLNEGQAELADNVISGVEQMQQLVATLLNTGRIEEGRVRLEKQDINVEGIIKKIAKDLQPRLYEKHLILEIVKPKVIPLIKSDSHHLREVISNLIVNAVQYSKEYSKITVSIGVDRGKKQLSVQITDRGIGIPKENYSQIFSPFYRAENAISHFTDGTGLGLYTVKLLVTELDGTIDFKSIENKGTTFTVRLPL